MDGDYKSKGCLVAILCGCFSVACVHTAEPHEHIAVPGLALGTQLVVRGHIADAETREPLPYVAVYLVDVRHENWESLSEHSARLGTANRMGEVDLAATWAMSGEPSGEQTLMAGFDRLGAIETLVEAAEARCHAGTPASLALVVSESRHELQFAFFDAGAIHPGADGVLLLDLGQMTLAPRPASDYLFYQSFEEATERGDVDPEEKTR